MTGDWAPETNIDDDMIEKVQATLTVDMIMTPRKELSCCKRTDNAEKIISSNTSGYSAFPVVDDHDRIVGIFRVNEPTETSEEDGSMVCSKMEALSEKLLIGAKDRILDYVMDSVNRPIQLVISDHRVIGLVTPPDLQRLPVRVMLFSLITSMEIAMMRLIEAKYPSGYTFWYKFLSARRGKEVNDIIQQSKNKDLFIRDILYTQIADKRDIISKGKLLEGKRSRTQIEDIFKPIIDLRNNLFHANNYANTERAARLLPDTIRSIIDIKDQILRAAKEVT